MGGLLLHEELQNASDLARDRFLAFSFFLFKETNLMVNGERDKNVRRCLSLPHLLNRSPRSLPYNWVLQSRQHTQFLLNKRTDLRHVRHVPMLNFLYFRQCNIFIDLKVLKSNTDFQPTYALLRSPTTFSENPILTDQHLLFGRFL